MQRAGQTAPALFGFRLSHKADPEAKAHWEGGSCVIKRMVTTGPGAQPPWGIGRANFARTAQRDATPGVSKQGVYVHLARAGGRQTCPAHRQSGLR